MATYRPNVPPSPNPSIQSDRRRRPSGRQMERGDSTHSSRNSLARRSTGSSIYGYLVGGREIEATQILEVLQKGIVILTGGRDPQGGPLITFPANGKRGDFSPTDIATCLKYLAQIPSEEYKRRGFSIVIDSRDGSWSNLVTVLGCLKQSLGEYLKQVFVIQSEYDRRSSLRRERPSVNIEPLFVSIPKLHEHIERNQLTTDIGGFLPYNHNTWLQNRLDLERFLRDAQDAVQHLDQDEVQIQQTYSRHDPQMSPVEALRQHRFFQDSILSHPTQVIASGKDLLTRLQYDSGQTGPRGEEELIPTLDNLEAQKQTKRVIQYLENRADKLQDFLDDRDKSLNLSMQYGEWKTNVQTVVDWVLGPGEKLLASQTDIGDSYEAAENLRKRHEELQIKCTDTYGQYAELRHEAETMLKDNGGPLHVDIKAQRDYMDTVCRSFASRLERRRVLLITSVRFHRLAEEFSQRLDNLLELLCSDVVAEDVESAESALLNLQQQCEGIDESAQHTLNDGQSLLDEMSRPIKNAFGKDISPDYAGQIKHVTRKLEELQERKLRCDELADVRRLKLQQILQLRTCEKDADQAIDWILELCDVMVTTHTDMGRTHEEAETLQEEHRNFESTAAGTYEYGKQLLQAALVLRRSLRYDLEPNNIRAQKLEYAWKRFTQGTSERANRLTVSAMFLSSCDKLFERIEEILVVISQALGREVPIEEVLVQYTKPKELLLNDCAETKQMGTALLDRLALPVIMLDENDQRLSINEAGTTDTIHHKLRKLDRKVGDLDKYWAELENNQNNPDYKPKLRRTLSSRTRLPADTGQSPPKRKSSKRIRPKPLPRGQHSRQDSSGYPSSPGSSQGSPGQGYPGSEHQTSPGQGYLGSENRTPPGYPGSGQQSPLRPEEYSQTSAGPPRVPPPYPARGQGPGRQQITNGYSGDQIDHIPIQRETPVQAVAAQRFSSQYPQSEGQSPGGQAMFSGGQAMSPEEEDLQRELEEVGSSIEVHFA